MKSLKKVVFEHFFRCIFFFFLKKALGQMICLGKNERLTKKKKKRAQRPKYEEQLKQLNILLGFVFFFINYLLWHLCVNYRTKQRLQHICNYSI